MDKLGLEKKIEDVDKRIANNTVLPKSGIPKSQVDNTIDIADKNREKIKNFRC